MERFSKDLDRKLYAAAISVINRLWGDTIDPMQQDTLANQIVREIEARGILTKAREAA